MDSDARTSQANLPAVKQAIVELRRLRAKLKAVEHARCERIAIVGMGLRLPGQAVDEYSFWRLLKDKVDSIVEIPPNRWRIDDYFDPDPDAPGKMYTRHGGFLQDVDGFDAEFFRIAPREAIAMDPQQRLLLEVAWEALENAAIAPSSLAGGRSGVYVGLGNSDYGRLLMKDEDRINAYTGTGLAACVAAGRLSYTLGLTGPSMAIDSACSSSLAALAQACVSLRRGECDLALAGGVNLILTPEVNIAFSKARMMAPDGRCKTFDARADGYVRGEGCAVLALKRLSDAERDGDPIIALLRGVAVNQDGASSGFTVPSGPAQEAVIRAALADAGVEPADIDYVEAHGTATSLGDPIEIHALGEVFTASRPIDRPLIVGSVKTNVGHLEAAAGIAGVIKVALSLKHGLVPPNLHFAEPSPQIDWVRCPFKIPTEPLPWPEKTGPRLAGVSSFGFSGTNAHVILEAAPTCERTAWQSGRDMHVLCLSATSHTPLRTLAQRYADHLQAGENSLSDVALTANTGRSHFTHRLAVQATSCHEAAKQLAAIADGRAASQSLTGTHVDLETPQIAFLFTGQGAQYIGMGRRLYESRTVFRTTMDRCDEVFRAHSGKRLLSVLYATDADPALLEQTAYAQPALFALEVSLAALWRSWGVEPAAVLGHSLGEYAAAYVAGVFSLEDGVRLTAERGRLMQETPQSGAMAAVFTNIDAISSFLEGYTDRVAVAAINGPENTVLSGESSALSEILDRLDRTGIAFQRLQVSHAFHSPLIEPALARFDQVARDITYAAPTIDFVSGRTGALVGDALTSPAAWVAQSREPVQFRRGIDTLVESGYRLLVEIGPHPTLLAMGRACRPNDQDIHWLPSLRRGCDDQTQITDAVATLYVQGVDVAWEAFQSSGNRLGGLPTYPFERDSYWWTAESARARSPAAGPARNAVLAAGRAQAGQVPIDLRVESYAAKWSSLNRLSRAYMLRTLAEVGAFPQVDEVRTVDEIVADGNIQGTYRMLLGRWLDQLATDGLLERRDGGFSCRRGLPDEPVEPALLTARKALEDIPPLLDYIERSGRLLTLVLQGKETALETLFPGGSSETATWLYKKSPLSRYFNAIAAAVVESFARQCPENRSLRLLEVGAGTGSTTASILPQLPPDRAVYAFTDVSDFFLSQAKEQFAAYPFLRYGLLDLERDPVDQGFAAGSFDVIIGANVLHATRDLEQTLTHVRSLLAPDGLFVLIEVTNPPRWYDISVSLIEGWQRFEDSLRADSPLLPVSSWKALLDTADFEAIETLPGEDSVATILGTRVIVARAPASGNAADEVRLPGAMTGGPVETPPGETAQRAAESSDETVRAFREQLGLVPANERVELLTELVRDHINRVLRRNPEKPLDQRQNLMDLGIDSLMAVELRNLLSVALGLDQPLPATLVFDYPSIQAVAAYLDQQVASAVDSLASERLPSSNPAVSSLAEANHVKAASLSLQDIQDLSDDAVEALLLERLGEDPPG